jgi:hypothetical protein
MKIKLEGLNSTVLFKSNNLALFREYKRFTSLPVFVKDVFYSEKEHLLLSETGYSDFESPVTKKITESVKPLEAFLIFYNTPL